MLFSIQGIRWLLSDPLLGDSHGVVVAWLGDDVIVTVRSICRSPVSTEYKYFSIKREYPS